MAFRSLVPFQNRDMLARPESLFFGPLHREIDRLFDDFARTLTTSGAQGQGFPTLLPRMDVTETDDEIEITVEMPGLERKDVDIAIEDDVLTIRGEKVERSEGNGAQQAPQGDEQQRGAGEQGKAKGKGEGQKSTEGQQQAQSGSEKNKNYHVNERSYGVFLRVLQLPSAIDPSSVEATMSKGVLRIRIPKPANTGAKKIEIKEAA
ncbi:MAG TPA: Hsp20/alpha crystallin family protein [Xanthobacteraceae bacterium]|jgi:HSP20 family protein|nr:Hsp20/alpha crystallin family protein [Xanthobacteraceae bacterium]